MMTLQELYELELQNYRKFKIKEDPALLLAMLLLSKREKFRPVKKSDGLIFKLYESLILLEILSSSKSFSSSLNTPSPSLYTPPVPSFLLKVAQYGKHCSTLRCPNP